MTALAGITGSVEELASLNSAVAAAVEEQGAATNEIARNSSQASSGVAEVRTSITEVSMS